MRRRWRAQQQAATGRRPSLTWTMDQEEEVLQLRHVCNQLREQQRVLEEQWEEGSAQLAQQQTTIDALQAGAGVSVSAAVC